MAEPHHIPTEEEIVARLMAKRKPKITLSPKPTPQAKAAETFDTAKLPETALVDQAHRVVDPLFERWKAERIARSQGYSTGYGVPRSDLAQMRIDALYEKVRDHFLPELQFQTSGNCHIARTDSDAHLHTDPAEDIWS
jgi:hypothetical protein